MIIDYISWCSYWADKWQTNESGQHMGWQIAIIMPINSLCPSVSVKNPASKRRTNSILAPMLHFVVSVLPPAVCCLTSWCFAASCLFYIVCVPICSSRLSVISCWLVDNVVIKRIWRSVSIEDNYCGVLYVRWCVGTVASLSYTFVYWDIHTLLANTCHDPWNHQSDGGWWTMVVHLMCKNHVRTLNTTLYLRFILVLHTSFTDGARVMGMLCCCHCINLKRLQYMYIVGKTSVPHNIQGSQAMVYILGFTCMLI